jgi:hypothetical protein
VLLYLLKSDFMAAFDFDDMRRVFLEHPSKLRTADIQSAFMHLSSGRKESEISFLNKSSTQSIAKNTGYYTKPTANGGSNSKKSNLDPIGFKNFQFTIIVPKVVNIARHFFVFVTQYNLVSPDKSMLTLFSIIL